MVGFEISTTPPQPPPSESEAVKSTSLESLLKRRAGRMVVKSICWAAVIAETAVIIANQTRKWTWSPQILSSLVFTNHDSPNSIRCTPLYLIGTSLVMLGGYIRYRCYKEMGKMFTFEMCIRRDHELVTSGPYSIVRHPAYTGTLCTCVGMLTWQLSPGSWVRECGALSSVLGQIAFWTYLTLVSTICSGLMLRMSKEEEALKSKFGKAWEEWAERVRYKLVPGLY
ncbi:hypothetical protein AMATHDRAFT_146926 [Amanita thiersii Skay4041]|uniref:Protein-S-isoprenylcysteine O-methyltransferase n=1 Tax=Amanita thiersii Skay4041 TaxID=703135 RepID=A0A2A9NI79_9AGAR|nr:hypothetical protein AMATHDRAFT_146926 [Amanita thiersii Skay4041]